MHPGIQTIHNNVSFRTNHDSLGQTRAFYIPKQCKHLEEVNAQQQHNGRRQSSARRTQIPNNPSVYARFKLYLVRCSTIDGSPGSPAIQTASTSFEAALSAPIALSIRSITPACRTENCRLRRTSGATPPKSCPCAARATSCSARYCWATPSSTPSLLSSLPR